MSLTTIFSSLLTRYFTQLFNRDKNIEQKKVGIHFTVYLLKFFTEQTVYATAFSAIALFNFLAKREILRAAALRCNKFLPFARAILA